MMTRIGCYGSEEGKAKSEQRAIVRVCVKKGKLSVEREEKLSKGNC